MNFSEFPLWQEGQSVGMLLASPRAHGETGSQTLLHVGGRQGNSMSLGHELPLQHPGMGLSQNTEWGKGVGEGEWAMGLLDPLCSDNCSLRCCGGASSNIKEGLFQALLPGVGSWIQLGLSPQFQGLVG